MFPTVYKDVNGLRTSLRQRPHQAADIAFVPTMGFLHEGHATLIRRAAQLAPRVVVSVFVNPLQFGPKEDFSRYPRDLDRDIAIAAEAGATDIYAPDARELTPPGLLVTVDPGPMADVLCGRSRPGHFRGVTTIVSKLFHLVPADVAVFGWKDAQQLLILQKMVSDLNMPIRLEGVETVRESDGLAMSSRNTYLTSEQRAEAPAVQQSLQEAVRLYRSGETSAEPLAAAARDYFARHTSARLDYLEFRRLSDLSELQEVEPGNTLLATAAYFGTTRLIDNVRL